jgi:hypothetical protein
MGPLRIETMSPAKSGVLVSGTRRGGVTPTGSQLLDSKLREHICHRIAEGRLPVTLPEHIEAAHGSGNKCHACDQPITSHQVECDVEDPKHGTRLTLHLGCHVLWQIECVKRVQLAP